MRRRRRRKGRGKLALLLFCTFLGLIAGLWWQYGHPWPGGWLARQASGGKAAQQVPAATGKAETPAPRTETPGAARADASATARTDPSADAKADSPPATSAPLPPPPAGPTLWLDQTTVGQGQILVLHLLGLASATTDAKVTWLADHGPWVAQDGGWSMLLAVPDNAQPGKTPVKVTWPSGTWSAQVSVQRYPFTEDRLTVTKQQADSWQDPQVEKDGVLLNETRHHSIARPLWQGAFIWPVKGPISTYFGEIRYVNGSPTGQHTGTDIAAPTGTPVRATNSGRVVLVRMMVLTGNTILIDHGGGLYSLYGHLSSTSVKEGEQVARGHVIGKVGSTGFSTGPHLHWTMSVGNTFVNPALFADQTLLTTPPGRQELR